MTADGYSLDDKRTEIKDNDIPDIINRFKNEAMAESVKIEKDLAIVMIVGQAMEKSVGIMARAASALSAAGINLKIVNQGASEISLMFGVSEAYSEYAVRVLYKELFRY